MFEGNFAAGVDGNERRVERAQTRTPAEILSPYQNILYQPKSTAVTILLNFIIGLLLLGHFHAT